MSEKLLKLVKRLRDTALDLYHQPARSHVPVDRADLRDIVEDWSRLVSENLTERLEVVRLKSEIETLRQDAERWRFVRNPTVTGSPFAIWSERTNLFLGKFADEAIDAAMSKEPSNG